MTVTAQTIIDRVRTQLIDTGSSQRWTDAELVKWLSDGQRAAVAISPGCSSDTVTISLIAGTKQYIPDDGHMLLTIIRNVSSTGSPGRAVRIASRELLDAQNPDWHSSSQTIIVQNYIFDPQQPKEFYVYPPNNGSGKLDIMYSILPPELTGLTDTIDIQEVYQTALVDYVLYRANQKDSDFAAGQQLAATYYASFIAYMQAGEGGQLGANPNLQLAPADPGTKGAAKL